MSLATKAALALVLVGIVAGPCLAQNSVSTIDPKLEQVLSQMRKNRFIVVRKVDSGKVTGKIRFMVDDTLHLGRRHKTFSVSLSEVDSVWTRGRSCIDGALVGGVAGLLIGGAVGAYFRDFSVLGPGEVHNERIFIGGAVGLAIGAGLGAAVGFVLRKHKLHYARPQPGSAELGESVAGDTVLRRMNFYISPDLDGGLALAASLSF